MRIHPQEWIDHRNELVAEWRGMYAFERQDLLRSAWETGYADPGYAAYLAEQVLPEVVAILPRNIRWSLVAKLAEMAGLVQQAVPLREAA